MSGYETTAGIMVHFHCHWQHERFTQTFGIQSGQEGEEASPQEQEGTYCLKFKKNLLYCNVQPVRVRARSLENV